ncbi:phage holin family protein [Halomonas elongata]|uniref:phage holin family protein n=1 Tax=Halomonas elongata TaxID=2746 RepID=UPI00255A78C2|nr:phage holin family protein [Halomonas elongata]MDL4861434.1 phage holin family protein [Halomonas elongata]
MTKRKPESRSMPGRDPNNWQWLLDYFPHLGMAVMTFAVALARGVHEGSPMKKALLGAVVCTLLAIALYPVFLWLAESRAWPQEVAIAPCVFLGFLGTEWIRSKADDLYDVLVGRWKK